MEYSGIRVLSVLLAAHCKQASKQASRIEAGGN